MKTQKSVCFYCIIIIFLITFWLLIIFPVLAAAKKTIYGYIEPVTLFPGKLQLDAKLDTGAETASLSAKDINLYQKDGKQYVKFKVSHPEISREIDYDLPLVRITQIKSRADEKNNRKKINEYVRPVVKMPIHFDGKPYQIMVNLIDRSHFSTPMLLGRNTLKKLNAIVDGTTKYTIMKNSE